MNKGLARVVAAPLRPERERLAKAVQAELKDKDDEIRLLRQVNGETVAKYRWLVERLKEMGVEELLCGDVVMQLSAEKGGV